jgi:hypothetical protein
MPRFAHVVTGPLGGNRQAVQLARKPHGEIADVDHLLDFAQRFLGDLACLDGDQASELSLVRAKFVSETADELAANGGRDRPPAKERGMGPL